MKKIILSFCIFFLTNYSSGQSMKPKDAQFATDAYRIGLMEIRLGELSISKASSDSVKVLGRQMILDHTKSNDDLKALAVSRNIILQTTLDAENQAYYDELSNKSGGDFDKAYIQMMVNCHQKSISMFKDETNSGSDNGLKTWAAVTLPILEHHLMMSQDLNVDINRK